MVPVVSLRPRQGSRCFFEQETLPSLFGTVFPRNGFERDLHQRTLLDSQSNQNKLV